LGGAKRADMIDEQRKSPRIDFYLDVDVEGKKGRKKVRNFGLYGFFVQIDNPSQYIVGENIRVVMRLPSEPETLKLNARIAHVSEKGIGVEFKDLPPKEAMSLEYCFHVFRHTTPLPGSS
jgi:hypothetical protein